MVTYTDEVKKAFDDYFEYISKLDYYNVFIGQKAHRTKLYRKFIECCKKSGVNFIDASAELSLKK